MQNETVSLRILTGDSRAFPLVRYPINPRHRTARTDAGNQPKDKYAKDGGIEGCHF
jgi:hypothetical protein